MISYFGGKNRMAEWIYKYIPKDIDTYAEPFSGSFWVYFNKKLDYSHIKNIRYNDINRYVCNLFSCAKDYEHFLHVITDALNNKDGFLYTNATDEVEYKEFFKQLYYDFKNNPQNDFLQDDSFNIPDYEVGMKYAFLITSAFNGCWPKSAGFSGVNKGKLKMNAFINKLKDVKYQEKLDAITSFETLDFEKFLDKYDDEKTFFYLDPPYEDPKNARLNWYGVNDDKFGRLSHKRLADKLKTTEGRWALSYYYYDDLEVWFPKDEYVWIEKDFFRSSASFSENKSTKGRELLILNYKPDVDLVDLENQEPVLEDGKELADKIKNVMNNIDWMPNPTDLAEMTNVVQEPVLKNGKKSAEKMKKVINNIDWLPDTTDLTVPMTKEESIEHVKIIKKKIQEGEKSGFAEDFDPKEYLMKMKKQREEIASTLKNQKNEDGTPYFSDKFIDEKILKSDTKIDLMELRDDAKIEMEPEIDSSELDFSDEKIMKTVLEESTSASRLTIENKKDDIDDFWNS